MYSPEIDLDKLLALDIHVHIESGESGENSLPDDLVAAAAKYFKTSGINPDLASVAQYYRERNMAAVVFTVDAETALGHPPISSKRIAEQACDFADVLIPFGSVDPLKGQRAIDEAIELVEDFGVRGFKLHPTVQGFDPSAELVRPLWAAIDSLGVPVIVHTGQTGIGSGTPGGRGLRLGYSNPILLDEVYAEFPTLQIVMAHPSAPWVDEQISVATHKANAWIDLSGWSPKYFPEQIVRAANSFLQDKVMFGSDFPLLTTDRWMKDFGQLDVKDEVLPKIFKDNAIRLLGLS
jgi:predicted TIM-barrel fold metal-dependent hydrolase